VNGDAETPHPPSEGTRSLRTASPRDRAFLRDLSGRVFGRYGQYDRMVPQWLGGPGVSGWIALESQEPVGFALTCLARLPARWSIPGVPLRLRERPAAMAVDLLAIAIVPERQGRGLGGWLLDEVIARARQTARTTDLPLAGVTLTVAADNRPARRLFARAGFRDLPGPHGTYPHGQPALHLALPL